MENKEITTEVLINASHTIQDLLKERPYLPTCNIAGIEEALQLALDMFQSAIKDSEAKEQHSKFYAPLWVNKLLERIAANESALTDVEYNLFYPMVQELSMNDYKPSINDLMGYEVIYATPKDIVEIITALKHYFKLI